MCEKQEEERKSLVLESDSEKYSSSLVLHLTNLTSLCYMCEKQEEERKSLFLESDSE